jgi:hypothetical protein
MSGSLPYCAVHDHSPLATGERLIGRDAFEPLLAAA